MTLSNPFKSRFFKSKWTRIGGGILVVVLVLLIIRILVPGLNRTQPTVLVSWDQVWPSQIVGPSCLQIAAERAIPQDLAQHTCDAIRE